MRRILKAVFLSAMLAIAGNDVRAQRCSPSERVHYGTGLCR